MRLHAIEVTVSTQFIGMAISKRFSNKDFELKLDGSGVVADPRRSNGRTRVFPLGSVVWYEPMTEAELDADKRERGVQYAKQAAAAVEAAAKATPPPAPVAPPKPPPPDSVIEAAAVAGRAADTIRYLKDPATGEIKASVGGGPLQAIVAASVEDDAE